MMLIWIFLNYDSLWYSYWDVEFQGFKFQIRKKRHPKIPRFTSGLIFAISQRRCLPSDGTLSIRTKDL